MKRQKASSCCSNTPCCCRLVCIISSVVAVCFLTALSITILLKSPGLLSSFASKQIKQKVSIVPGHSSYDQLQNPSLPIYLDVYFFNWTNYDNYSQGIESAPRVEEIGPYSFREIRQKYYNESSLIDNRTKLNYTQLKTFHFDPDTSGEGLAEDDIICTINLALVGAIAQVLGLEDAAFREIAIGILKQSVFGKTNPQLHICQPAAKLVFNYTDPLVEELHTNTWLRLANMNLPTNYVSIQLNASVDDSNPSIIDSGVKDIDKLAQFYQWNGKQKLDLWFDDYANTIRGTEGILFKPNLVEGEGLNVFVDNVYRSFPLINTGKRKIKGLETFRYEIPMSVFESAHTNPNNSRWGSWCPDGMFYIGVAQKPAVPVFASKPRFMDTDKRETSEKVHLLPPVREKHDTFLFVHPLIGSTLQFSRSLQINLQVNYTTRFSQLEHVNGTTYFPVFYISEHSELTDSFKSYIMKQGLRELEIANYSMYTFVGILFLVVLVLVIGSICCIFHGIKHNKRRRYTKITE